MSTQIMQKNSLFLHNRQSRRSQQIPPAKKNAFL